MDAFVGEIRPFAFNWAPADWLYCNGQSLPAIQYQALYAVIGTLYGSQQTNFFNLPNLMGQAVVSAGQGPGLSNYQIAASGGDPGVTLNQSQMPYHNHGFSGSIGGGPSRKSVPADNTYYITNFGFHATSAATAFTPANGYVANPPVEPDMTLNPNSISLVGGVNGVTASHENRQPFLAIGYYICTNGYFPSRP